MRIGVGSASRALLVALAMALTACGAATSGPVTAPANANSLPPAPAHTPADFHSLAALEAALEGVATCTPDGTAHAECALVTAPDQPFLVQIFGDAGGRASYLASIRAADTAAAARGVAPLGALAGPSWAAVPAVTAPGILAVVRPYLGGTVVH